MFVPQKPHIPYVDDNNDHDDRAANLLTAASISDDA